MAILQANSSKPDLGEAPPVGQHLAVCLAVKDEYGVERPSYDNPEEMEKKDVSRVLFGTKKNGETSKIETFEMRISGNDRSNMHKFFSSWLGYKAPAGFDTESMVGKGATITVSEKVSRAGTTYRNITNISPVMAELEDKVPKVSDFDPIPDGKDNKDLDLIGSGQPF